MRTFLTLTTIAVLSVAQLAHARSQDAAIDARGSFVTDTNGNCVRTKWTESNDPCGTAKPVVSKEQRTIHFGFDSAALDAEAVSKLSYLANIINHSSAIADVRIIGFTDSIGASSYNAALSARRAQMVKQFLDRNSRLDTRVADIRGLGESSVSRCSGVATRTERIACMRPDRRVEVEFKYTR